MQRHEAAGPLRRSVSYEPEDSVSISAGPGEQRQMRAVSRYKCRGSRGLLGHDHHCSTPARPEKQSRRVCNRGLAQQAEPRSPTGILRPAVRLAAHTISAVVQLRTAMNTYAVYRCEQDSYSSWFAAVQRWQQAIATRGRASVAAKLADNMLHRRLQHEIGRLEIPRQQYANITRIPTLQQVAHRLRIGNREVQHEGLISDLRGMDFSPYADWVSKWMSDRRFHGTLTAAMVHVRRLTLSPPAGARYHHQVSKASSCRQQHRPSRSSA